MALLQAGNVNPALAHELLDQVGTQLFAQVEPTSCDLANSAEGARAGHPLGFTLQGCDVYSRMIYGTRASLTVGVLTTLGVLIIGGIMGALAGYYGGWLDVILARIGDIFFALPLILGAIVINQLPSFRDNRSVWTVVVALVQSVMSWGNDISAAQPQVRNNPGVLLWPAVALSITVLSFIMLGDALRDALDPKARKR